MKAINIGNQFSIYDDSLKVHDKLPAQIYSVRFSQQSGFYLELHNDIEINETKIYGVHNAKTKKVINTFKLFNRNLGIILSGDKGIGKSLFAKLLSNEAVSQGYPVIIVDKFIPNIAAYLESIEQEVVILFDEFDKTFGNINTSENEPDAQASMLSLFDGLSTGKKMFVLTCNEIRSLNDYYVNRTGRFHYHFRFNYPDNEEIREYLTDKLDPKYYDEINKVIAFANKVKLNYDSLRSIAFELNLGENFENVIADLNIMKMANPRYDCTILFENGRTISSVNTLDLFANKNTIHFYTNDGEDVICYADFQTSDCTFDTVKMINVINGKDVKMSFCSGDWIQDEVIKYKDSPVCRIEFRIKETENFKYKL